MGLRVCAVNFLGSSFRNEGACEELDIVRRPVNDQEDSDEGESAYLALQLVARTRSTPIFGARSGLLLATEHVRIGRQTELDSRRRHRVIEEVPNGPEGTHVQGGWTEDYKKCPLCRSRFVAKQLASSAWDDVTQSSPHCWSSGC